MADVLSVGIDLGGDTLKLSYAYVQADKVLYGKIEKKEAVRHVAVPAVAYYDPSRGWIFGSDVEKGEEKPFINVVKIKSLLSLLYPVIKKGKIVRKDGKETCPNKRYYYEGNYFPKFFFPNYMRDLSKFGEIIEDERAFKVKDYTPQRVCKEFFEYVRGVVTEGVAAIEKKAKRHFDEMRLSVVHPVRTGKLYVEELTNLVRVAFGKVPFKVMNSGRALSTFAMERGAVKTDDEILIFDMGEDTISVLKCFLNDDGKVVVEPAADHSAPVRIGGNDVDFSIAEYIEKSILKRETVGSPSYGQSGHIHEEGLQAKQYLFLKEIKKAKLLLSIPRLDEVFKGGVPVSLHRDLYLQLRLTKDDLKKSVGITDDSGIARRILDYILEELKLPINSDVKRVFFTGGLVETCGLLSYIKQGIRTARPGTIISTFDDNMQNDDGVIIQSYEDSSYAPSVGAAIVALKDYDVSAGLAYSYGTWFTINKVKVLGILVSRGYMFDEDREQKLGTECNLQGTVKEEFFSIRLSRRDVERRKYEGKVNYVTAQGVTYLCIGEAKSQQRQTAEKLFQLKNISGPKAMISCTHRGRQVSNCDPRPRIIEGVMTRPDSSAMVPFVEDISNSAARTLVTYSDGTTARTTMGQLDIELVGVNKFSDDAE